MAFFLTRLSNRSVAEAACADAGIMLERVSEVKMLSDQSIRRPGAV